MIKDTILIVDDVFKIAGRGVVVTGNLEKDAPIVRINDFVEISRPDGVLLNSQILGIELFGHQPCSGENRSLGILLKDISKSDVPSGSILRILKDS